MLTNSELPLCMLDQNLELNGFDFVLYHLYESSQVYRDYYLRMREDHPERLMILDNSAYEFFIKGETLNMDAYVDAINDLNPDMYILPDTLMNMEKTLKDTKDFMKHYHITHSDALAVAQGNTPNELTACLLLYKDMGIKNIAIPFHNSFFKEMKSNEYNEYTIMNRYASLELTEDMRYALGRIEWVGENFDLLKSFNHVHLLGSHCPFEKAFYNYFQSGLISTMDTGYPVKCAIEGYKLCSEPKKPEIIIDDFLYEELSEKTKELIKENVSMFRDF